MREMFKTGDTALFGSSAYKTARKNIRLFCEARDKAMKRAVELEGREMTEDERDELHDMIVNVRNAYVNCVTTVNDYLREAKTAAGAAVPRDPKDMARMAAGIQFMDEFRAATPSLVNSRISSEKRAVFNEAEKQKMISYAKSYNKALADAKKENVSRHLRRQQAAEKARNRVQQEQQQGGPDHMNQL